MSKKKKETAANDEAPQKQSFERRSFRFVLKLIGYMFFIAYLIWAVPHVKTWAAIKWVQRQPIEKLAEITPDYIYARRPDKIYTWVKMRKADEIDRIMEILEPYTGDLSPLTFVLYADRLVSRGDMAEAIFWHQFALYRMRFDALRCGQDDEAVGVTFAMAKIYRNKKVMAAIEGDPLQLPRVIRAVLDMDAKYPARNNPIMVCSIVRGLTGSIIDIMPEQDWAYMRHMLRNDSEAKLALLQARLQKEAQENVLEEAPPEEVTAPPEEKNEDNETTETP